MQLIISDSPLPKTDLFVCSRNQYYSKILPGLWLAGTQDTFQLLFVLFQMTVIEMPKSGVPGVEYHYR